MVEIRRAGPADVPALLPLVDEYWSFERIDGFQSQVVAARLEQLLVEPGLGAGWIAVAGDAAAGYLLVVYVFSLEHLGVTAEIDEFFVAPGQRGRGIGRELLRVAESECRRAGCTNISLQLSRHNDGAREFYRRHGYTERAGYELLDKALA